MSKDELPPHYTALSIGVRASPEEVRSAYRRAALATHPDKGGDSAAFLLVVRAFEVLSDHIARQKYDLAWRAELYQELGGGKTVAEQAATSSEVSGQKRKTCSSSEDKPNGSLSTHADILESLFVLIKKAPRDERSALFKLLPRSLQSTFFKRFEKACSADEAQPGDSSLSVPVDSDSSSSEESEEETEGNPALALEDSSCADGGPTTSPPVGGRGHAAAGWPSLRQAWIRIQLEGKATNRAERSREDLEALTQRWEQDDSSRRAKVKLQAARRAARLAARERGAAERCQQLRDRRLLHVRNLVARYGSLDLLRERKEAAQRRKLNEARLQWHRRKDLTMEEILRGPPM
ncbi:unnamed protein product [Polarella glacialis]|uniref:J domain-containing protein n=1 Tax=Polarella glacialis TaxID=89957 RepID=A0A813D8Z8_POLGL|nr:unnamed protein product [Polarella glacialis]